MKFTKPETSLWNILAMIRYVNYKQRIRFSFCAYKFLFVTINHYFRT